MLNASLPVADNPFVDPQWDPPGSEEYADLPTRMGHVVVATSEWAFDHANELRSVLAASLSPDGAKRRRRTRPCRRSEPDAVVWTTDAAELERKEATDQLRWTAETLVRAVLAQA